MKKIFGQVNNCIAVARFWQTAVCVLAGMSLLVAVAGCGSGGSATDQSSAGATETQEDSAISEKQNSEILLHDGVVSKDFIIEVDQSDEYYFALWAEGLQGQRLKVVIDNDESNVLWLRFVKDSWQKVFITGKSAAAYAKRHLVIGSHRISFRSNDSQVPQVAYVALRTTLDGGVINEMENKYAIDLAALTSNQKPVTGEASKSDEDSKSATEMKPLSQFTPKGGNYTFYYNETLNYTYRKDFHFYAESIVTFRTQMIPNNTTADPVIQFFNKDNPNYSWYDDDSAGNRQASLTVFIPLTGWYQLVVRAWNNSYRGIVDVYMNDKLDTANAVVGGTKYLISTSNTGELNYFTRKDSGDPYLWVMDSYNIVRGHNDDYLGSGDFSWGTNARVKKDIANKSYVILTSYSAGTAGKTDLYLGCMRYVGDSMMAMFPKLKADDAIQSAPMSNAYNCMSWAGGRIDLGRYFWPHDGASPWKGNSELESIDNFLGNKKNDVKLVRFNGAMNYTSKGATEANSSVALWGTPAEDNSDGVNHYRHASVRAPGDGFPHGYDWESKDGGGVRFFHPRNALGRDPANGEIGSYGKILYDYRWDGTYAFGTAPPVPVSIEADTSLTDAGRRHDVAEFSPGDNELLSKLKATLSGQDQNGFEQKYLLWKNTWKDPKLALHSNPRMFTMSSEYKDLLMYCKSAGKRVWPLVFEKYINGEELVASTLIQDLTLEENQPIMDAILQANLRNAGTLIPSQKTNWNNYVKKLLEINSAK